MDAIILQKDDNVATALREIASDKEVIIGCGEEEKKCLVRQPIPYGHKFAVKDIQEGENIMKYGEVIGRATCSIPSGTHVHIQNVESLRGRGDLDTEGAGCGI